VIRKPLILACVVGLSSLLFSGCGQTEETTPQKSVFELISKPSFVKTWDVQVPIHNGDTIKGIYYVDGNIHVLTSKNFDHAVKGDSGELLYRNEIGTPDVTLTGGPTLISGGMVFPTTHTLEVYTRGGNPVRSIDVKYNITNQAVGHGNYVYIGMDFNQGCLAQVDVTQQISPVQWTFMTFGTVDGPVAVSNNIVYCGSEDGKVRAALEDRTPYWPTLPDDAYDTQSKIVSGMAADGDTCYCSTIDGKVIALDKENGRLKWEYYSSQPLEFAPQASDSGIYQYVPDVGLVALDKSKKITINGQQTTEEAPVHTPRWTLKYGATVLAEDDQNLYVTLGTPDHFRGLCAVDKQTGQAIFQSHRRDLIYVAAQPKGGLIYGITRRGLLIAFKPVFEPGSYGEVVMNTPSALNGLQPHVR
jgi:outer membrane protein assembly factor BamB